MVFISMDKKFVDKNLQKWNRKAIEEYGEESGKECYLYEDEEVASIDEIDENGNWIKIVCETSPIGYISMYVDLDTDDLIRLIEIAVKKMNKFKNILESLK